MLSLSVDNNIFYVRRSWLQRRQREIHAIRHPRARELSTNSAEVALALSAIFGHAIDPVESHVTNPSAEVRTEKSNVSDIDEERDEREPTSNEDDDTSPVHVSIESHSSNKE